MRIENIKISKIHTDKNHGTWWAVGTKTQWFEFRVTKTGRLRLFGINKGKHPYFTITDTYTSERQGDG